MRPSIALLAAAVFAVSATPQVDAASYSGDSYPASSLVAPCQTADSDSREEGRAAEIECEQYIMGFVDALAEAGAAGPGTEICAPPENTADEVRWAFMRWVYGDYAVRTAMPAADAVMATLKEVFPCE